MEFTSEYEKCFGEPHDYESPDIDLIGKLQDARHALQESQSEVDQLKELINLLYSEARVENVAVSEITSQMKHQLFRNIPLPRNADNLPLNEMAGYALYYMKFLGYATRKAAEEYHTAKDHLDVMHTSVKKNTEKVEVKRTGVFKVPELDGRKEMKRSDKTTTPITPPATPPENKRKEKK